MLYFCRIKLLPIPMHGTLTNDEQLKAFRPAPRGYRKVVFSTNVAETSVTISGIVYGKFNILNRSKSL